MIFNLVKAEFNRYKVEILNYYPDQIVDIIIKYLLFMVIFKTNTITNFAGVLAYLYWNIASTLISEISISMSSEKQIGTIDQLMLNPFHLTYIIVIRSYVVFLFALLKSAILIAIISLSLKEINFLINTQMILIFLISLIGFTGLGLILSALTLKYVK